MISSFSMGDISCRVYVDGKPQVVFYWGTAKNHTDLNDVVTIIKEAGGKNYILCAYEVNDWNNDFSPWQASGVFGKESFSGKGSETLSFITKRLMPYIKICYPEAASAKQIIAGYSLAGLFSLWAALSTKKIFDGAISCSGSFWFPGWDQFLTHSPLVSQSTRFFISLGDTESSTRNKVISTVADNTIKTVEILKNNSICKFEWNSGGHFDNPEERMAKAFKHFLD